MESGQHEINHLLRILIDLVLCETDIQTNRLAWGRVSSGGSDSVGFLCEVYLLPQKLCVLPSSYHWAMPGSSPRLRVGLRVDVLGLQVQLEFIWGTPATQRHSTDSGTWETRATDSSGGPGLGLLATGKRQCRHFF